MSASPFDRRAIPAGAKITTQLAHDGLSLRRFDWPAVGKARGSILFQGGRGDIFEKYLEIFDHWHAQKWNITSLDWRGQSGSGRLSSGADCGHVEDFAEYIADLRDFGAEWHATMPPPHVVMGHSMGGHLVLRGLVEGAIIPDAAVLVAPMLGLKSRFGAALAERLARMLGGIGNPARPAWKRNERPYTTDTRQSLLTHDRDRYADELWWHEKNPATVTGPPSWKWLIEAFRSTRELRGSGALNTMQVPVLALIAEVDGLVDANAALAMLSKLPDARVVRFGKESAHEILREGDKVRNRAIGEIDLFLQARAQQP